MQAGFEGAEETMTIGDIIFKGGLWGVVALWGFYIFATFMLNEDLSARTDTFANITYVCFFAMILGTMLKYTGRMKLKYSRKKCIKCPKAAAMGSIYCEFHRKMAAQEMAFNYGAGKMPPGDEDDENLGY
jgi:hypothetical protein